MSSELRSARRTSNDSWHITQYCRSTRAPPWNVRFSWQPLQVSLSTISRRRRPPAGRGIQVKTPLFAGMFVARERRVRGRADLEAHAVHEARVVGDIGDALQAAREAVV